MVIVRTSFRGFRALVDGLRDDDVLIVRGWRVNRAASQAGFYAEQAGQLLFVPAGQRSAVELLNAVKEEQARG